MIYINANKLAVNCVSKKARLPKLSLKFLMFLHKMRRGRKAPKVISAIRLFLLHYKAALLHCFNNLDSQVEWQFAVA